MNDTTRVFPANAYSSKGLDTWDLNHNLKEVNIVLLSLVKLDNLDFIKVKNKKIKLA